MVGLPPQYVYAPASLVYGDLPRSVILTGIRIWGLGWRYRYERTGKIREQELLEICGLSRSQLYEHLGRLVATGVLRFTNIAGGYLFVFDRTAARIRAGPGPPGVSSPENRTPCPLSVVVGSSLAEDACLTVEEQQQHVVSSSEGGSGGEGRRVRKTGLEGAGESGKPDWAERLAVLARIGVWEPVRSELAGLKWATREYLTMWAEWFEGREDQVGVGLLVLAIRRGDEAPATVARRGRDPRDYVSGEYADLIQR